LVGLLRLTLVYGVVEDLVGSGAAQALVMGELVKGAIAVELALGVGLSDEAGIGSGRSAGAHAGYLHMTMMMARTTIRTRLRSSAQPRSWRRRWRRR
jgi:hypothetical protein